MADLVTTAVDYNHLDDPSSSVRIRLQSTVVKVQHRGEVGAAPDVEVSYACAGRLESVRGKHVILACWHRVIPHICSELPQEQVQALNDQRKVPLIYTNVLIRNWTALNSLGVNAIHTAGHFWRSAEIDFPVSMGDYRFAENADDPVLLHMPAVPTMPGLAPRAQASAGRARIATMTFSELERSIRDLLARALARGGFDPARDIEGICVNRWSHGYAYEYMRPWDAYWPNGPLPIEVARRPMGRIAIANADSGAYAYAHSAMDQAIRAVRELLGSPTGAPAIAPGPGPQIPLFRRAL
jgi:spermidine dehydrogenase